MSWLKYGSERSESVGRTALTTVGSRKRSVSFIGEPLNSVLARMSIPGLYITLTVFALKRITACWGPSGLRKSNGTQPIKYSDGLSPTSMQVKLFASIACPRAWNV